MTIKRCKGCGGLIEQGRVEMGLPHCLSCAQLINVGRVKGRMIYEHKTGGFIEVMSSTSYSDNKKYFHRKANRSIMKQV